MFDAFTYENYGRILDLLSAGRRNLTFAEHSELATGPFFILRHDVDLDLDAAVRMAELEAAQNLHATYFILLSNDYYNVLSPGNGALVRRIAELGHEVGLHYDIGAMSGSGSDDIVCLLQMQANLLGHLAGRTVVSVSMHNPSSSGDDPLSGKHGFIDAYDAEYTKKIAYFSDSCGAWRDATYRAFVEGQLPPRLQFLFHPIFWRSSPPLADGLA